MEGDPIIIKKLVNDIKTIETDKTKNGFICDYNKLKESINKVDTILKSENKKEDKLIKSKNIKELYEMLDTLDTDSDEKIDAEKLRKMKIVLDTLENKMQNVELTIEKIN